MTILGVFIFGFIIDKNGRRAEFLILTNIVLIVAHVIGAFLPPAPLAPHCPEGA